MINNDIELTEEELSVYLFNQAKQSKSNEINNRASNVITNIYPEWKQINLSADREFALGFIAKFKAKSNDAINSEIIDKLMGLSLDALKSIRDNFSSLSINDLLIGIPDSYIQQIILQYQNIANSYIAYVLIKEIRTWSILKISALNNLTTIEDINNLLLTDCINL